MNSIVIRNTFTGIIVLAALMILATSTAIASEVTGVLNSSGSTPTPSEESAPVLTGSVTSSSSGESVQGGGSSGSSPSSSSGYTPTYTSPPPVEVTPEIYSSGTVLSSYTDTPNVPLYNSSAEHALPLNDSGSESLAISNNGNTANSQFLASVGTGRSGSTSQWWWLTLSFLVVGLVAGLSIYRLRHNKKHY